MKFFIESITVHQFLYAFVIVSKGLSSKGSVVVKLCSIIIFPIRKGSHQLRCTCMYMSQMSFESHKSGPVYHPIVSETNQRTTSQALRE